MKESREEGPRARGCRSDVLKHQLGIFYIGLGIEKAHHAYSKHSHTYTADDLFGHLMEMTISLYFDVKRKGKLWTVVPLKLQFPPNVVMLGAMSELVNGIYKQVEIEQARLRKESFFDVLGAKLGATKIIFHS